MYQVGCFPLYKHSNLNSESGGGALYIIITFECNSVNIIYISKAYVGIIMLPAILDVVHVSKCLNISFVAEALSSERKGDEESQRSI